MECLFRIFGGILRPLTSCLVPGGLIIAFSPGASGQDGIQQVNGDAGAPGLLLAEIPASGMANGVTYERWDGAGGNRLSKVNRALAGKQAAAAKGLATSLELFPGVTAAHVTRVRGYFVAPKSGEVQFVLSSDDNSELWLSRGEDPFARRRAAWIAGEGVFGWTKPGETGRIPSQWTAPMQVEQGKRYYFEALHKQGSATGHMSVRMRYKGEKNPIAIPSSALQPWLGIGTDSDDDGLPDSWQQENGLTGLDEAGSSGDPDGDGVSNFDEFVAGTAPMDPSAVNGMLLWEAWYGVRGSRVVDLVRNPRYAGPADHSAFVSGASTPKMSAGNSGARLSGCLVPQESGEYVLGVTGDDVAELWFSENESPFEKKRVAYSTYWLRKDYWMLPPSQQSKPVVLEAGQPYYFEILLKDSVAPGWAALGWKKKGEEKFTEVPKAFLRSPGVFAEDKDRDMLPDRWEQDALALLPERSRAKVVFTEHGDPDRDGLPNWLEERWQTNPLEKSQVIGGFVTEWWHGVPSRSLDTSRDAGVFLKTPSMVEISLGAVSDADTADWFASRRRGYVVAPASGRYRFWVSGDDQVEFWISSDSTKFRKKLAAEVKPYSYQSPTEMVCTKPSDWDARPEQQSVEFELKKGEAYFIELLQTEGMGNDHVALAWQYREAEAKTWSDREPVATAALLSFEGDDDDRDDDYLPDSWEKQFGLDPKDNGSKDFKKQGEAGDHDGDLLTNREEFLLGTNPCLADTDGDGVGDYDEVKLYGSNPAVRDASPPVLHEGIPLASRQAADGLWSRGASGSIFSTARRGAVDFPFNLDGPGIFVVEVEAKAYSTSDYAPPIPIIASVDGVEVGRDQVSRDGAAFRWLTPWLPGGGHKVTVDNRNLRSGMSLEISAVRIYRHEGEDLNGNAVPDWMENMFRNRNRWDGGAEESAVSPLCLEGMSRIAGDARLVSHGKEIPANIGLTGRWYADIPLQAEGDTTIAAWYEGGALSQSGSFRWVTTNLFEAPDLLEVRVGDSLKVTAVPPGTDGDATAATYTLEGEQVGSGSGAEARVVKFDRPGVFTLSASTLTGTESLDVGVMVKVVAADFGAPFDVAAGSSRVWKLPGIPRGVSLEAGHPLVLEEQDRLEPAERRFNVSSSPGDVGSPTVLARLSPSGPILASTSVNVFRIVPATESGDAQVIDVLPDGTRVVELLLRIDGKVPADLSVWIEFFVTDAIFANGDTRYHLTAADFDANGVARLVMFKAPGDNVAYVCHWIRPYDQEDPDAAVGEPAVEEEILPNE